MKQQLVQIRLQAIGFHFLWVALNMIEIQPAIAQTNPGRYNCLTRERFALEKQIWCNRLRILQNTSLIVPASLNPNPDYTTVTLTNGRYQREDRQFFVELANDPNWQTFGDINGDGKADAAVIFGVALDPDGKQIGTYLTAVLDIEGEAEPITPIRLGERILLNRSIAIQNNQIIVPFLTQNEAFDRAYQLDMTLRAVPSTP